MFAKVLKSFKRAFNLFFITLPAKTDRAANCAAARTCVSRHKHARTRLVHLVYKSGCGTLTRAKLAHTFRHWAASNNVRACCSAFCPCRQNTFAQWRADVLPAPPLCLTPLSDVCAILFGVLAHPKNQRASERSGNFSINFIIARLSMRHIGNMGACTHMRVCVCDHLGRQAAH